MPSMVPKGPPRVSLMLPHTSTTKAAELLSSQDEGLAIFEVTPQLKQVNKHWFRKLTSCLKPHPLHTNELDNCETCYRMSAVMLYGRARNIMTSQADSGLEALRVADPVTASALIAAARCATGGTAFELRLQVNLRTFSATLVSYLLPSHINGCCDPAIMIQSCLLEIDAADQEAPGSAPLRLKPAVIIRGLLLPAAAAPSLPPRALATADVSGDTAHIEAINTNSVGQTPSCAEGGMSRSSSGTRPRSACPRSFSCKAESTLTMQQLRQRQMVVSGHLQESRRLGPPSMPPQISGSAAHHVALNSAVPAVPSAPLLSMCKNPQSEEGATKKERKERANPGDGSGDGDASTVEDLDLVCLQRIALDGSPCLITVVRYPGAVLYQNAQSEAYFGDMRGQAACVLLGMLLGGNANAPDAAGGDGFFTRPAAKPALDQALEAISCGQSFSMVVRLPGSCRRDLHIVAPCSPPGRRGDLGFGTAGASGYSYASLGGPDDSRRLPSVCERSSRARLPLVDHVDRLLLAALESSDGGYGAGMAGGSPGPALLRGAHRFAQSTAMSSPHAAIFQSQQMLQGVGLQGKLLATATAACGGARSEQVVSDSGNMPPGLCSESNPVRRKPSPDMQDCPDVGDAFVMGAQQAKRSELQEANTSCCGGGGGSGGGGDGSGGANADVGHVNRPGRLQQGSIHLSPVQEGNDSSGGSDGAGDMKADVKDAEWMRWAQIGNSPATPHMAALRVTTSGQECLRMASSLPTDYVSGLLSAPEPPGDINGGTRTDDYYKEPPQCCLSRWLENNTTMSGTPPFAPPSEVESPFLQTSAHGLPAMRVSSLEHGRTLLPPSSGCATPLHAAALKSGTLQRLLGAAAAAATSRRRAALRRTVSMLPGGSAPTFKGVPLTSIGGSDIGARHESNGGGTALLASPVNAPIPTEQTPVASTRSSLASSLSPLSSPLTPTTTEVAHMVEAAEATATDTAAGNRVPSNRTPVAPSLSVGMCSTTAAAAVARRAVSMPRGVTLLPAQCPTGTRARSTLAPKIPPQPISALDRNAPKDMMLATSRGAAASIGSMRPGSFLDDFPAPSRPCAGAAVARPGIIFHGAVVDSDQGRLEQQNEVTHIVQSAIEGPCLISAPPMCPLFPLNASSTSASFGRALMPNLAPPLYRRGGGARGGGPGGGLSALLSAYGSALGFCPVDTGVAHEEGSTGSGPAAAEAYILSSNASNLTATLMSDISSIDANAHAGQYRHGGTAGDSNAVVARSCTDAMPEASLGLWGAAPPAEPLLEPSLRPSWLHTPPPPSPPPPPQQQQVTAREATSAMTVASITETGSSLEPAPVPAPIRAAAAGAAKTVIPASVMQVMATRRCASSTAILHFDRTCFDLSPQSSLDESIPTSSSQRPPTSPLLQPGWQQPSGLKHHRKPLQRTNTQARLRQLMSNFTIEARSPPHHQSEYSNGDQPGLQRQQDPSSPAPSRRLMLLQPPGDTGSQGTPGDTGLSFNRQQHPPRLSTFDELQGVAVSTTTTAAAPSPAPALPLVPPGGATRGASAGGSISTSAISQPRRATFSTGHNRVGICENSEGYMGALNAGRGWTMQVCAAAAAAPMEGAVWHRIRIQVMEAAGAGGQSPGGFEGANMAATDGTATGGRGQLLVVTQEDVTEHFLEYQPMAKLLQKEHKVLESIFPRHCIEYLTEATGYPSAVSDAPLRAHSGSTVRPASFGPTRDGATGSTVVSAAAGGGDPAATLPLVSYGESAARLASLATAHSCVTVLFCDIVGFTEMCHSASPFTVMSFLNDLYSRFDSLVDIYKVYKVETIGDCYMVAGGLVTYDEDGYKSVIHGTEDPLHAVRTMEFAKAVLRVSREVRMPHNGQSVQLRVGLHSGPVTSGVVGDRMPRFCLFGDTVNVASRMESTCRPGCIHVSAATRERLSSEPWRDLGMTAVKGKGSMRTFEWSGDAEEILQDAQVQRLLGLYL